MKVILDRLDDPYSDYDDDQDHVLVRIDPDDSHMPILLAISDTDVYFETEEASMWMTLADAKNVMRALSRAVETVEKEMKG